MQITGKLGDVMQGSVKAAKSYIRSKSLEYGIIPPIFDKKDFHIHVPELATPKIWTICRCGYGHFNNLSHN